MKKLLTILILLLAVVTQGYAEETITKIYPINCVMQSGWAESVQISSSVVNTMKTNDVITVYVQDVGDNAEFQFQSNWGTIKTGESEETIISATKGNIDSNAQSFSLTITSEIFNLIKDKEMEVKGVNYTITKITLNSGSTETALFGAMELNWSTGLQIEASDLPSMEIGDVLKAEFDITGNSPQGQFKYGNNWDGLSESMGLTSDKKYIELSITQDIKDKLASNKLVISGQDCRLTGLSLIHPAEDTSALTDGTTNVWGGNTSYDSDTKKVTYKEQWAGFQSYYEGDKQRQASRLYLEFDAAVKLRVLVGYTDGYQSVFNAGDEVTSRSLKLESSKIIEKIQVYYDEPLESNASKEVIFKQAYFDNETGTEDASSLKAPLDLSNFSAIGSATYSTADGEDKYKIKATAANSGVKYSWGTEVLNGTRLYISTSTAAKYDVIVTYSDNTSASYKAGTESVSSRTLKLESDKLIKEIQILATAAGDITLSEVYVDMQDASSAETPTADDPNLIWSGSQELTSTALAIAAGKFSGIESGNRIRLTIGSTSNDDKAMQVTYTKDANTYETFNGSVEASKTYDFEITPTNIEAIKANGISITGSNATLTKIERITDGYSEGTPSLDDLPAGWSAVYNSTDKVITFSDGWQAKGWNIGTATYNEKKDFVVTFAEKPVKTGTTGDAVNVMLYVDYVNQYGKTETLSNSTSTDLSVSIPLKENEQITNGIVRIINILIKTDVATTLKLSSVAFNEYVPRTSKDLSTGSQKIRAHSSVAIAKGMFVNAAVGDVLTINVSDIAEGAKYSLKGHGEDDSGSNWSSFVYDAALTTDATPITRTLTSEDLAIIKDAGLSIEGNGFTCGNVTLSTAGEVGTAQTHTNPTFTLTINEAIGGSVKVKQDNTETNERTFALETEVTLEPVANTGFTFSKWMKGDTEQTAGENNSLTLSITDNVSVTALFNAQALADNSSLTIWQGEKEASWGELLQLTSSVTNILERFETIRITASPMESVTNPDAYFKVFFNTIGGDSKIVDWESAKITGANQVVEYNLPTTTIVDQLKGGFGIFGQNVKITKVELIKPTIPVALADEEKRTVWSDETGVALNWGNNEISISALDAHVLKAGDQVIVTSIVNQPESGDPWPKAFLADGSKAVSPTIDGTECIITLTSEIVEKIKDGFYISGGDSKAKKIEFYKPVVIFVDGEANLERGVEDGGKTTFTALHDEVITGNVLVVESNENATVKVTFSDNTTATNKPGDRKIGNPTGSQALVLLDRSKFIKTIEIDKAKAAITKIYMSSLTLFEKSGEDYIADLSLAKAMDNTTFDTSSYTIATTVAWSGGIQLDVLEGETVKGKELMILTESDADLKVTVEYESGDKTEVQDRPASKEMKIVIDGNRAVKQILIQPKTASVTKLLKVAVNASATPDPNVFSKDDKGNFVADLSMVKAEGATYNNTTFTMVATDSWQGVTVTPGNAEVVKGKELYIEFDKAALGYAKISYVDDETSVEGGLDAAGTVMKIALDDSKQISKIEIKLKEAGTAKFKKIAVNATETADESGDDDEEAIIDEKTGEADLNELSAQDDTKTTLTQNEDGSITMTTTEPYCAAQIWFNNPEEVAGNVLKVQLAESSVNVTVTVKYTDGTQSQMSANTMAAKARGAVRAATRADSGTEIEVPLETGKEVQNIEVKNNVAGTITIQKMQVTTINIFTNGVANLSMLKPQSNATYDTSTHTLATTKGWTGATISPVDGEKVSGKELLIEFAEAAKVKVAVKYRTDVEGPSIIMEKAAANVRLALDNTKNIQEISIQPTEAAIVTFTKIAVNSEETDDGSLKPGKTITLWESATGETLAWNEVAKQDASVGEMLKEYDELLITVSGVAEDCDWPKVFLRDANSEQAGNEVLLNDVASFPYTVRIVLTGDMAEQLANGFCVCGDGITVTKLVAYRPEEPKEGDIHLADLNYGYNSSYDKGTHTITTTSRWAARGWEIGDKRYNDKNLIIVKFEPVDFPVTLKMEYTTGVQTAQATSVGVPAGRTELMLEIPQGISKLNRVYLIYEEPGSLRLTEASVVYQDKLKLSTAIQAFEAEGVIRDGRYDTDGWYNLRGMRIQEPKTSGVYIHGGKKVVIY